MIDVGINMPVAERFSSRGSSHCSGPHQAGCGGVGANIDNRAGSANTHNMPIYTCTTAESASFAVEGGRVLPEPGQEATWIAGS